MPIELVTTDGIFALDGGRVGRHEQHLVGRRRSRGDRLRRRARRRRRSSQAVNGRRGAGDRADPRAQRPHQRRGAAARRGRRADRGRTTPTGCCGTWSGRARRPTATSCPASELVVGGHELARAAHARPLAGVLLRSTTSWRASCSAATRCSAAGRVRPGAATATSRRSSRSIREVLLRLPDETVVHTGHGESTTIGAERAGVLARAAELGV